MFQLRNYQDRDVSLIRAAFKSGLSSPLYVAPTGSGKTVIFSFIAHHAAAKGNRVTVLSHRKELIRQIERAFISFQIPYGVISAGRFSEPHHPSQIAGVQTLARRIDRFKEPDLLIIDEAHHATSDTYQGIIAAYPRSKRLGVTATPERLDGRGLGDIFDNLIIGPTVQELIDQQFLATPIYYAPPSGVNLSGVHTIAGDFNRQEVAAIMDKPVITGSAVDHYRRLCDGQSALAFCATLKHAANVRDQFTAAGYSSEMIDGAMDENTRADIVTRFGDKRTTILVSVDLLGEGFDAPGASVAILLRPTASLSLHLQQLGRVLRPAPGKTLATVLDHVGNCLRHGLAEEPREWDLNSKRRTKGSVNPFPNRDCPQCYCVHAFSSTCPNCGHVYAIKSRIPDAVDGELQQLTGTSKAKQKEVAMARDREALTALAKKRGYKPGWVFYMLKIRNRTKTRSLIDEQLTIKEMAGIPAHQSMPSPVDVLGTPTLEEAMQRT